MAQWKLLVIKPVIRQLLTLNHIRGQIRIYTNSKDLFAIISKAKCNLFLSIESKFNILHRKNKVKALFGYWTHCFYTCDASAYEDYIKSGKRLPTLEVDEFFVEKNIKPSHYSNHQITENQLEVVNANLKKKYPKLFDLKEIWRAAARPSYSNDVIFLQSY